MLGEHIANERRIRGMTQVQFASFLNFKGINGTRQYVSLVERDKTNLSLKQIEAIAKALDCTLEIKLTSNL